MELEYIHSKMLNEYKKTPPLYSEEAQQDEASILQITATTIAQLYRKLWYNTGNSRDAMLFRALYPALYRLSLINGDVSFAASAFKRVFRSADYVKDKIALAELKSSALKDKKGNLAFDGDGYIIEQRELKRPDGSLISYNMANSPANGCGWISAYNALKILGNDPDPYAVMREVESGALAVGKVGTDPFFLQEYFQNKGYHVNMYFTQADVEREAYRSDACIFVYGYLAKDKSGVPYIGAHFIAGYPESDSTGNMRFFNDSVPEVGPLSSHYANNQIFRFAICINVP